MSHGKDIDRKELQEMARIMLNEIYSAEHYRSRSELIENVEGEERSKFGFEDSPGGVFTRQSGDFENAGTLQKPYGKAAEDSEFYPRMSRREYLNQRLERRGKIENDFGSGAGMYANENTGAHSKAARHSENLLKNDLPEKLSDVFCRDARRYDGAFERY
ncbi:MAG: hypothetical protein GXY01_02735 [Clostridiales bacterium]|jgi:hypothetical protein|nr:hypothetical protein [Clostridiales bacterium]